jgi:hypothetical protein
MYVLAVNGPKYLANLPFFTKKLHLMAPGGHFEFKWANFFPKFCFTRHFSKALPKNIDKIPMSECCKSSK